MAIIFVHDYHVQKKKNPFFTVWAIPCSNHCCKEELKKKLKQAITACYRGLSFNNEHGEPIRATAMADIVVEYAFQRSFVFWEFQQAPGYAVVAPANKSIEHVTHGLMDIEDMVLKERGWSR